MGTWDDAFARFAQVQADGFALVRGSISAAVNDALANSDQQSAERLTKLDAQIDSLAAGYAQFAGAAPVEVPAEQLPPVVNPDTPPAVDTVPDVVAELPVDPQAVVDDPSIPTPNDEGSAG